MNKWEFLNRLEQLLYDLPEEEKESALEYYKDYFEEAGPDMEFQVIRDLGSPERIAAIIKTNLIREVENRKEDGEFTEHGYSTPEFEEKQNFVVVGNEIIYEEENKENEEKQTFFGEEFQKDFTKEKREGASYRTSYDKSFSMEEEKNRGLAEKKKKKLSGIQIALLILFVLIGLPVIFGVAISAVGTIFGLFMGVIACVLTILFVGFILAMVGVVLIGIGIVKLFTIPLVGIYLTGSGLVCFGLGLILSWLTVKGWSKGVPFVIAFFKHLWHGKKVKN